MRCRFCILECTARNDLDLSPPLCSWETKAQRSSQPKTPRHQGQPCHSSHSLASLGKKVVVPHSGGGCLFCFYFLKA